MSNENTDYLIPLRKASRSLRGPEVSDHGAYQWAWSAAKKGDLPHVKIGNRFFMTQAQINSVLSGKATDDSAADNA